MELNFKTVHKILVLPNQPGLDALRPPNVHSPPPALHNSAPVLGPIHKRLTTY